MAGTYAGSVIVDADTGDFRVGCAGVHCGRTPTVRLRRQANASCLSGESLELVCIFDLAKKG